MAAQMPLDSTLPMAFDASNGGGFGGRFGGGSSSGGGSREREKDRGHLFSLSTGATASL